MKKNINILRTMNSLKNLQSKKKKKKRMKAKRNATVESIDWWGLASKVPTEHKYKLPLPKKK